MNICTIPLRNARRKLARTLLLILVFALGVTSIVALNHVSTVVGESLEKKLTAFGANILVFPKAETLTVSYGGFALGDMLFDVQYLSEVEAVARIRGIHMKERISAVAPKLVVMSRSGDTALGVVGVRFAEEKLIKSFWAVNGRFPEARGEVLAGSALAARFGLAPGAFLDTGLGRFAVAGVLEPTGGDDDNVLLADLGELQALSGKPGAANFIEVAALCAGCPIEEIIAEIGHSLHGVEIKAVSSIIKQRMFSITFVQRLALILSIVILVTACAMVGLSMLSAVNERKKEIGILRSLGYSKADIFGIFSFEALFLGFAAGAMGYVAGYLLSFRILDLLGVVDEGGLTFNWAAFAGICLLISAVSVLSAAIPAWKASRVEPSEALVTL